MEPVPEASEAPSEAEPPHLRLKFNGLNPKIVKFGSAVQGYGLRTTAPIAKGEIVWQGPSPYDRPYPIKDIKTWPEAKWKQWRHYLYQVDDCLYGPKSLDKVDEDDSNFLNHSCEPNLWFDGPLRHVAMRDIAAGEELFYDYGTENLEDDDFACLCNSPSCRKVITKDDWKLPSVQEKHGDHFAAHVMPLVRDWQQKQKAKQQHNQDEKAEVTERNGKKPKIGDVKTEEEKNPLEFAVEESDHPVPQGDGSDGVENGASGGEKQNHGEEGVHGASKRKAAI